MIEARIENGGMVLTINRPAQRNALSTTMYNQLRDGLQAANDNTSCHSVIITGAGGHFTAGNDLADFQRVRTLDEDSPALSFLRTLASVDVPVIAAVEGVAVGVGVTMLQHCDFVFADSTAMFSLPFVSLGLCPEGGSSILLEQIAGRRKAAQWLMQAQRFDAREALEADLITAVSPGGKALDDAREAAASLAAKPLEAVRLTKRMLREPGRPALMQAFDTERKLFGERLASEEAQAAFKRFFER
ncbi:enoyl-CoA hydratase [Pusillimonas sp. TS35]|jgi:enoyl-CoA hydratase/carnithine racemase|uniref:enoyl-CoA hydratase-related protein n=1 Tax=Paracandidimonas lactea TaxID=2895524 RepID=UPI00136CB5AB|nr:enoyl-CoA hydratase-related protein [Paracandidimonas lactea]MYN13490.1 enoyl-CoA hydratase [Pusillimonas sp. TS35]